MQEILEQVYGRFPGFKGLVNYCVDNNITEIPTCADENCNNHVTYNKAYPNRGFAKYCSSSCSRKNKTIPQAARILLDNKQWLYNQRITQKKAVDTIAKELEISRTPVLKYIKKHNIPEVRYNSSMCTVLEDKEKLNELYDNNTTMSDIAKKLGVSTSTVSRFFQKHNIQAQDSNTYPRTYSKRSKGEQEVCDFLTQHNIQFKTNDTSLGFELDIVANNIAIEYNGLYYHTEKFKKDKEFHFIKTINCEMNGLRLFHLWEDQWRQKPDVVKSTLLHIFNKTEKRIYARKCKVLNVSGDESRLFLNDNHLQGYTSASIKLGLYHEGDLLAIMTFSKPRFNKKYEWELVRFATKNYTHIPGAFTKLLSAFKKQYEGSIITYADLSYSEGNVYKKNGFKESLEII